MGFNFIGNQVVIIKNNPAGVINENRDTDIIISAIFTDLFRRPLDIGFIKTIFKIIKGRGKDRMFAVLRPGLGQRFKFEISRSPFFDPGEIVGNCFQRVKIQRQGTAPHGITGSIIVINNPAFAESDKFGLRNIKINPAYTFMRFKLDPGYYQVHARFSDIG